MKKIKLNKQTIFTLLGILVICGSIPLAVLLVKQRQEIRKEAATNPYPEEEKCGQVCLKNGAAGVDWPHCSCTNKTPEPGYERIGTWNTVDCPQCTGYSTATGGQGKPVWGRWNTGKTCSVSQPTPTPTKKITITPTPTKKITITPTPTKKITITPTPTGTGTPTPTGTITPTPTGTVTPTPTSTPTPTGTGTPTPTPTILVDCNQNCSSDINCSSGLICYNSNCRNSSCPSETNCTCPGPTSTPTVTPTLPPGVTPTTILAQVTPTPVELPQAGFTWPTFGAIFGGMAFILIASLLFLL